MVDGAFVVVVSLLLSVHALPAIVPSVLCLCVPAWERCYLAAPVPLEAKYLFGPDGRLADRESMPNLLAR
jgi:hypothetical protein